MNVTLITNKNLTSTHKIERIFINIHHDVEKLGVCGLDGLNIHMLSVNGLQSNPAGAHTAAF